MSKYGKITDKGIERLARNLAKDWVYDWCVSDTWAGYPNGKKEEKAAAQGFMPRARETVYAYIEQLTGNRPADVKCHCYASSDGECACGNFGKGSQ